MNEKAAPVAAAAARVYFCRINPAMAFDDEGNRSSTLGCRSSGNGAQSFVVSNCVADSELPEAFLRIKINMASMLFFHHHYHHLAMAERVAIRSNAAIFHGDIFHVV